MKKVFNYLYYEQRKNILLSLLALFSICGILGASTLTQSSIAEVAFQCVNVFVCFSCCLYLFVDLINKQLKVNVFGLILILICVLISYFSKSILFIVSALLLCSFEKSDFEKCAKVSYFSLIVGFALVVAMVTFGIIPDLVFTRGDLQRFSLGFVSSTIPQSIFLFIVLISFYVKKTETNYAVLMLYFLVSALLYQITDARTGFYLCIVLILIMVIIKLLKNRQGLLKILHHKFTKITLMCLPVISVLIFGLMVFLYQYDIAIINDLDLLLSGRIKLTYEMFLNAPITLFGGTYFTQDNFGNYIGVDNAFFYYMFMHGIFGFILVLMAYVILIYLSLKEKNYWLLLCVLVCLVNGFVEPYLLDIKYSIYILFLCGLFVRSSNGQQNKHMVEMGENNCKNIDLEGNNNG